MTIRTILLALALTLGASVGPAQAYVGPGAGVSLLGAAIGLIVAVVMAVAVIVLWPLRRVLKRRKAVRQNIAQRTAAQAGAESD